MHAVRVSEPDIGSTRYHYQNRRGKEKKRVASVDLEPDHLRLASRNHKRFPSILELGIEVRNTRSICRDLLVGPFCWLSNQKGKKKTWY